MKNLVPVIGLIVIGTVALAGCQRHKRSEVVVGGHTLVANDRLVCPEHQGALKRVAEADDGQTCSYRGRRGEDLQLRRVALNGETAVDRLSRLKTELSVIVPLPARAPQSSDESSTADNDRDHADINLPGLRVQADGDKATVNLPGIHIRAEGDVANISTNLDVLKNAHIDANENGAKIEADMTDAANVDMTWFVFGKTAGPSGDHMVGFYARGPKTGPLIVAQMHAKEDHQHGSPWNLLGGDDVHKLVHLSLK